MAWFSCSRHNAAETRHQPIVMRFCEGVIMVRSTFRWLVCITMVLAAQAAISNRVARAADEAGQTALDKATEIKLSAESVADFDEAVKLTPQDASVLRFRGMFHLTQNHFDLAIADLDAAIAIDPDDAETHEARGLALSLSQKYDDAMESFNTAIELAPDSPAAYTHRPRVLAIKGDAPAPLRDVDQALTLPPGFVQH